MNFQVREEYIMENGKIMKYMEEVFNNGQMVPDMKVILSMVKLV